MKSLAKGQENILQERTQTIQRKNEEAYMLYYHQPKQGLSAASLAYELSVSGPFEQTPYLQGQADSLASLSHYHVLSGKLSQALSQAERAMQIYQTLGQFQPQAELYGRLGMIFDINQNRTSAIEYLVKGLEIAKSYGYELTEAKILLQIANVYYGMGNYRQSLHSASQAEAIFRKYNNPIMIALALIRLAECHAKTQQMEKAFQAIYQALDLAAESDSLITKAEGLYSLGMLHLANNELPLARTHLQYCQRVARKMNLRLLLIQVNLGLSEILVCNEELKPALALVKRSLKEAEAIGIEQIIMQAHFKLAEIYEILHQFKLSLQHFKAFNESTNRIFDQQSQQKIQTVEVLYRTKAANREAELAHSKNLQLEKEILERKQAESKLRKSEKRYRSLASYDPLTHLFNWRHFFNLAEIEFERAVRYQHPLSLLMLDLDHFKSVNDRYGHLIGDELLESVATICKNNLRNIDIIGRYGGEEFIILLPETDEDAASDLAERIGKTIENSSLLSPKGPISITSSIGVCTRTENCKQLDTMIEIADKALYAAKQMGRNLVVTASNLDLETGEPGKIGK